jgi:hypothetical protein
MTQPINPAEAIFLALADLDSDERDAFLRGHCGHDSQLRAEVEAMLRAMDATDDEFLDPARLPSLPWLPTTAHFNRAQSSAIVLCCTRADLAAWPWCMRHSKSTRGARWPSRCCAAAFASRDPEAIRA